MEQAPTETKEPVEEKHSPTIIKSECISLGYPGKDGYYYVTKEEALSAAHPKTKAQQLINETIKRAMINVAFKKVLRAGQQGLEELDWRLQNLQKKKLVNQIIHTPKTVQCWRNSRLKKLTPIVVTPTEQTPVPQKQQKQYATRSNTIPLKQNQYLKQTHQPAEPLDWDTRTNEASLGKSPNVISTVKATITKALQYNKSAKSLLQAKRCYKCKGMGHQAKDCLYGQPRELLKDQDNITPSSTYQPLPHHPAPTIPKEERERIVYRPAQYVNLTDSQTWQQN